MVDTARSRARTREGIVVSDAMDKTIVVTVRRRVKHPEYRKYVQVNKRYLAHDERNTCSKGDRVIIQESRPLSKMKRWRLRSIVEQAVKDAPELKEEVVESEQTASERQGDEA